MIIITPEAKKAGLDAAMVFAAEIELSLEAQTALAKFMASAFQNAILQEAKLQKILKALLDLEQQVNAAWARGATSSADLQKLEGKLIQIRRAYES